MIFTEPTLKGRFLKRYKRFFADVEVDGEVLVAHVPNTGSLRSCLFEGAECVVTMSQNPARKLKATLQFVRTPSGWAGVNTGLANLLVYEAYESGAIAPWRDFKAARREFKLNKETRLDMVLARSPEDLAAKRSLHYVEIKNVTWAEGDLALFPDAETTRGQKHLRELTALKAAGLSAELVFVVQREGCLRFAPAVDVDPEYARLLSLAAQAGVLVSVYGCEMDPLVGVRLEPCGLGT